MTEQRRSDTWRRLLPSALIVLAVVLLTVWYRSFEWETKEIDLGATDETRRNPVLALQRLLEQHNQPVTLVRGFGGLDLMQLNQIAVGPQDTLVLINTARSLRPSQVEAVWRWVENGGRLLIAADNPFFNMENLDDPLLDRLGLALSGAYWDLVEEEEEENTEGSTDLPPPNPETPSTPGVIDAEETASDECTWTYVTVPVHLESHPGMDLTLEFNSGVAFVDLDSEAKFLAAYDEQIFLAHQRVGAGEIYALPSMLALDNDTIHCQDNAYVFWQLLKGSNKVWLVLNAESPSFWRYLWQLSALGCLALLAALLVWLWYKVPRFGPVLSTAEGGRRQFIDHIHASAQFVYRHQGNTALVVTLRDDIWHRLRLRHPGFQRLNRDDQITKICQFGGMTNADVQLALYRELPVPTPVFVDMVQRLQHLRNSL